MQTHIDMEFGDGTYRFRLTMAGIQAIQDKCNARIGTIRSHVLQGWYSDKGVPVINLLASDYGLDEVMEICRQGLIGGRWGYVDGREIEVKDWPNLASNLLRTYLHPDTGNPLDRAWTLAGMILFASLKGYEPAAEAQKKSPAKRKTKTSTTEAGSLAMPS